MQHRLGAGSVHTTKYRIVKLVYFEVHETLSEAITREPKMKRWRRAWKDQLIASFNPAWCDLALEATFP